MSKIVAESGAQLVARISSELRPTLGNLCPDLFPDNGPLPGHIVEITGESNTGKSHFLMETMARAILPVDYGGRGAHVVFLNSDNNFKMTRFLHILEKVSCSANPDSDEPATKEAIENSLHGLLVYSCYTSEDYEMALMQIEDVIRSDTSIALLAVDSMCAFYWPDYKESTAVKMETYYKRTMHTFQRFCQEYKLVVAFTRPAYFATSIDRTPTTDVSAPDYRLRLISHDEEGVSGFEVEAEARGVLYSTFYTVDNFGLRFLKL